MFELKRLTPDGIARAMQTVERYRLLNEPWQAESICRDVLRADPGNQEALVMMLLCLTDQFGRRRSVQITQAQEVVPKLADEYERAYYSGMICERWGKARLRENESGSAGLDWLKEAMRWYEKAEALQPAHNEDAVLRWNACARMLDRHEEPGRAAGAGDALPLDSDDDVPMR